LIKINEAFYDHKYYKMKVLIIEDEKPAADKLEILIKKYDPKIEIAGITESVANSVQWLQDEKNQVNLIFADIQLADGLSVEIFNQIKITIPVIFTTAYNEYAIEAFKVNSIDYLLKPVTFESLSQSLKKLESFEDTMTGAKEKPGYENLEEIIRNIGKSYKTRFMVKIGEHIRSVMVDKILLFHAEGRTVFIFTDNKRNYIIDHKLEDLEKILDPVQFFRLNRTFIVNINAIGDVIVYSNSRLKIKLIQEFEKDIIVSREKVSAFKKWFDGIR